MSPRAKSKVSGRAKSRSPSPKRPVKSRSPSPKRPVKPTTRTRHGKRGKDSVRGGGVWEGIKSAASALVGAPAALAGALVGNFALRRYISGAGSLASLVPPLPAPPTHPFEPAVAPPPLPAPSIHSGPASASPPRSVRGSGTKAHDALACDVAVTLAKYQADLVRRFVAQCRDQPGGLFLHRMGSGKTLSGLAVLHNLPAGARKIVLSPAGITSNFEFVRDDAKPLEALLRNDVFKMYPSQAVAAARAAALHVVAYTPKPGYDSLTDLLAGRSKSGVPLEDFFAGAYVLADEAHNLLRFMPDEATRLRVVGALAKATRIYLMTGTPIIANLSDIGRLVGLASRMPPTVMPIEDNAFKAMFFHRTWRGFAAEAGVNALYIGATAAAKILMMKVAVNLADPAIDAFMGAEQGTWEALRAAVGAFVGGAATRYPAIVAETLTGTAVFSMQTALQRYIATREYRELDAPKLLAAVSKYVTFFDYELVAPEDQLNFPKKSVVPLGVPYTAVQARLLSRMMAPRMLTAADRVALAMEPSEDPSKEVTFFKYARAVGNASADAYAYTTRWSADEAAWVAVPLPSDAAIRVPPYVSAAARRATDAPFECPKFAAAARLLLEHAVRGNPRMPTVQARYLPIVYSSFDELGFRRFGAYLTARGFKYLTFHEADPPAHRARMLELANARYEPAPAAALTDLRALGDTPVCVLLHPAITEGLSFTDAPAIVVLETIDGYGVQEQVYGRILRRYPRKFLSQAARATKTVYQMFGEWPPLGEAQRGALTEYVAQYNGGATGSWQVALYRDKFDSKTPELAIANKNEEQKKLLDLLAAAFVKNDDAAEGAVCDAARGGKPLCRACLRGDCDCDARDVDDVPCPTLPAAGKVKTEVKTEVTAEVKTEVKTEVTAKAKPKSKSKAEAKPKSRKAETQADVKVKAKTKAKAETEAKPKHKATVKATVKAKPKPKAKAKARVRSASPVRGSPSMILRGGTR